MRGGVAITQRTNYIRRICGLGHKSQQHTYKYKCITCVVETTPKYPAQFCNILTCKSILKYITMYVRSDRLKLLYRANTHTTIYIDNNFINGIKLVKYITYTYIEFGKQRFI